MGIPLKAERPAKAVNPPAALAQGNVKTVGQSVGLNKSSRGDSAITPWVREDKDGRLDLRVDLTRFPAGQICSGTAQFGFSFGTLTALQLSRPFEER